jgi:DHA2 family multidrug resistance protein-like MFS transporter
VSETPAQPDRTGNETGKELSNARRRIALLVLCAALFPVGLDNTALQIAAPAISRNLAADATAVLWILDTYSFVMAALLVPAGHFADRYGHRRLFIAGLGCFFLGSALGFAADTTAVVVAARAVTGVGAAMLLPASFGLIRRMFDGTKERVSAIGLWTAAGSIGSAIGPAFGGVLVQTMGWNAVFLVNLPIVAALAAAGKWLLPSDWGESSPQGSETVDLASVVVSVLSLFGVVYSVKELARSGGGPAVCVALTVSVGGLAWFLRRQSRLAHPVLDVGLFRVRGFAHSVACVLLCVVAVTGVEVLFAQYFQYVLGVGPWFAGLRMAPLAIGTVLGGVAGGRLVGRFGAAGSLRFVLSLAVFACAVLLWTKTFEPLIIVAICFFALGFGFQVAVNICSERILSTAPPERGGGAGAVDATVFELGTGLGVTIPGVLAALFYTARIDHEGALSAPVRLVARSSITDALRAAAGASPSDADAIVGAAKRAFLSGSQVCVAFSLLLLLCCYGLSWRVAPSSGASDEWPEHGPERRQ